MFFLAELSLHICEHTLHSVFTCARSCTVCSRTLGDEGGVVQLVYDALCLAWGEKVHVGLFVCIKPKSIHVQNTCIAYMPAHACCLKA